MNSNNRNKKQK